jgi:iron complex outermembrane receptor protein
LQRWVGLFAHGDVRDAIFARVSYTYNRFTFVEDSIFTGNDLPGAPRHYLTGEVKYQHPSGFSLAPSIEWVPASYFVNSANTAKNTSWANLGARAEWSVERLSVTAFIAGQNLMNKRYSGSVQVDNANGRFYEPSDPRSVFVGARLAR